MDWIVTTGSTEEEALEAALDQLSVTYDDVEYEVLKAPRRALLGFGTRRAQIRSRVRPVAAPAKRDRRRPPRSNKQNKAKNTGSAADRKSTAQKQQRAPTRKPAANHKRKRSPNPPNHQEQRSGVANDRKEGAVSTTRKRTLKADGAAKRSSNIRSTTNNDNPSREHPTTARRTRKIDH